MTCTLVLDLRALAPHATLVRVHAACPAIRSDRRSRPTMDPTLGRGRDILDARRDLDHARSPDPDRPSQRSARALRPDLPALRGVDAALLQPDGLAPARQD